MDDLIKLRRLIPAARIELERLERAVVTLQTANEKQFETICTLRLALDKAVAALEELGLRGLAAELDRAGRPE